MSLMTSWTILSLADGTLRGRFPPFAFGMNILRALVNWNDWSLISPMMFSTVFMEKPSIVLPSAAFVIFPGLLLILSYATMYISGQYNSRYRSEFTHSGLAFSSRSFDSLFRPYVSIRIVLNVLSTFELYPFPLSTVLPVAFGYYEYSVTIGVTTLRQSHSSLCPWCIRI